MADELFKFIFVAVFVLCARAARVSNGALIQQKLWSERLLTVIMMISNAASTDDAGQRRIHVKK